ncbi:hypothetical protein VTJ49DRAFT_1523 [Mycothermus thermophilus]|uniref:Helix-turn-helix domain-containing protein n=1 Tax=Humicola insolens TaxID=85995 RepID=A0ABR3VCJ8_HUMIN
MGAGGSKAAQKTVRKFPTRAPGSSPVAAAPKPPPSSSSRPPESSPDTAKPRSQSQQAFYTKEEALRADAAATDPSKDPDFISPDFAARLHKMGIVQPNPLWSPSSIANPFPSGAPPPRLAQQQPPQKQPHQPHQPQPSGAPTPGTTTEHIFPPPSRNVTLGVLEARRRLEARAAEELERRGRSSDPGAELLDVGTIKRVLAMREAGTPEGDIEARLRLRPGVVERLGGRGVVAPAS